MRYIYRIILLWFVLASPLGTLLHAQNWLEVQKIVANDRAVGSWFGSAVDIENNTAVVGSELADIDTSGPFVLQGAGAAYIFERDSTGQWNQVQKLFASDVTANEQFGNSVSISGDWMVIGAFYEDKDTAGGNPLSEAGAAYFFRRDTSGLWIETQKVVASDRATFDEFGSVVAIHGLVAIITAPKEDEDASNSNTLAEAGSAYIFELDSLGRWVEVDKIVATDRAVDDQFGYAADIFATHAVVGTPFEDEDSVGSNTLNAAGAAYIFEQDSLGQWSQQQKINATDREADDQFGWSVGIYQERVIVSAPAEDHDTAGATPLSQAGSAYIFDLDTSNQWLQTQKIVASDRSLSDRFGHAVGLTDNRVLVTAIWEDSGSVFSQDGAAYIFELNGNQSWTEEQKIVASDRDSLDEWGSAAAIAPGVLIVGTIKESEDTAGLNTLGAAGSAYIFEDTAYCPEVFATNNVKLCVGDSIFLGGAWQTKAGTYIDTLTNTQGCDSIVTSVVTSGSANFGSVTVDICQGDSAFLAEAWQKTTGVYIDTLTNVDGCDSLVVSQLTVNPTYDLGFFLDLCDGDSIFLQGAWRTTLGTFADTFVTATGCDSIVEIIVVPAPTYDITDSISICQGDSIFLEGAWQFTSGNYIDSLTSMRGCDSVVNITLTVNPTAFNGIPISFCFGDSVFVGGGWQKKSGAFFDTLTTSLGCDSVVVTGLSVFPVPNTIENRSLCPGDSTLAHGVYVNQAGTYVDTLTSVNGCDSVSTIIVTINPTHQLSLNESICQGDSAFIAGQWRTSAGAYIDSLSNTFGCDSVVTTTLSINPTHNVTANQTICFGDSILLGGQYRKTAGTYLEPLQTNAGCDSLVEVTLSVQTVDTAISIFGNTITANLAGVGYQWLDCSSNFMAIPNATQQSFNILINGTYAVAITVNGCTDTSRCIEYLSTGLEEIYAQQLSVFPNPAHTSLSLQLPQQATTHYEVVSSTGQVVLSGTLEPHESALAIESLAKGLYIVKIRQSATTAIGRFIKE